MAMRLAAIAAHIDAGGTLDNEDARFLMAALVERTKSVNWWQGVAEAKQTERDAALLKAIPGRLVPGDWSEADWADLFETVEAFKRRVMERHS